jgi:hypothetical protein
MFNMPGEVRKPIGAQSILASERYLELDWRQRYGECAQHDWKTFDFDGRAINAGPRTMQPWISEQAGFFVPLKMRRPSAPLHLGKTIVSTFTSLLFGEGRFPKSMVGGSEKTQDWLEAVVKASSLRTRMVQARNLGGAMGTVVLSWCFRNGKPRVKVHNAKNIVVHEWEDRDELIPAWASEIWRYQKDVWDARDRKYYRRMFWYRRDWTPDYEILFDPIPYESKREPNWEEYVSESNLVRHDDGFCHLVWIQNVPTDEIDGKPDYDGQYDALDAVDMVNSVLVRGIALNLDPTLVLKMDEHILKTVGIKKGSDNAICVGEAGDAQYLELSGSANDAGIKVVELLRKGILENAQCVVPDPNEIAASGTSSVAMKVIYRPTISVASVLREQYGDRGVVRLLDQMQRVAAEKAKTKVPITNDAGEPTGEEAVPIVNLPPKVVSEPVVGEDGQPTGEKTTKLVDQDPGDGGDIVLDWGEWFPMTPQDKQASMTTLSLATGGAQVLSKQTACEEAASIFGRDPAEEWRRANQDHQAAAEQEKMKAGMFGDADAGGKEENQFDKKPGFGGAKPNPFVKKPANPFEKNQDKEDDEEDQ